MSEQQVPLDARPVVPAPEGEPGARRIGVYVCHCGGNISDYVDVEKVIDGIRDDGDVVVSRTAMFACSDATQQDIAADIEANDLDGLVVASCSPKLHTYTFRGVASRAGLNPYEYTQVNIREQCSWVHTDDPEGATAKATALVKAGIGRTRNTVPLEPLVVETIPHTLVIGGGIAGLRAAVGLADIGLKVTLVERELELGGWVRGFGPMFPHDRTGSKLVEGLVAEVRRRPSITVLTGAEMVGKSGSFGNYRVNLRVGGEGAGTIEVAVGSIVVATGFDEYRPDEGELGYGIDGVVTLSEFKQLVDASSGNALAWHGRPVRSLAYVYCVGSRSTAGCANEYCSRFCCTATVQTAVQVSGLDPSIRQFHLYRDMRTYGKFEPLYTEARDRGSVFLKFDNDEPPAVASGPDGRLTVTVRDMLTERTEMAIPVDLVVLVTGMVPRENQGLVDILKLPGRQRRVLQRDPSQAASGRDRGGRRAHRRCLPGPQDLRRVGHVRSRRRDPERGGAQEGVHRARPAGRDRGPRGVHGVRRLPHCLPLRRDLDGRGG